MKTLNSRHPKQRSCHEQRTKHLVPIVTIFSKLPLSSGHLSITDKFLKTRRCPLFRVFTVFASNQLVLYCIKQAQFLQAFNDKVVTESFLVQYQQMFLVSHILLLFLSSKEGSTYEKLEKYLPYCTRHRAVTTKYIITLIGALFRY